LDLMPTQRVKLLVAAWFVGDKQGTMYDACTEDPEIAWQAILEILQRDLTDDERALLAAGPVEDLLVWHGGAFIDRIEAEAKRNPRFNHLLRGVWRREMPHEVWERIEKARKEIW